MKRKKLLGLACLMLLGLLGKAQEASQEPIDTLSRAVGKIQSELESMKHLRISGYIQPQFQIADSMGIASFAAGNFDTHTDKRFRIRRGRVKATYETQHSIFVYQIDMTERGFTITDLYARFTEPWLETVSLTAGMMNRPFGYEIGYSSSLRETPERGRMSQILFNGERDLGAMITLQAPKTNNWHFLKLEAGMYNGTGGPAAGVNASDYDYQKDFISHLSANRTSKSEKVSYGLGASYYTGGFRQGSKNWYRMDGDTAFKSFSDTSNYEHIAPRQYYGADAQLNMELPFGLTTLRAEYIFGRQSGTSSSTTSPILQPTGDCYTRNFNGAYFYYVQNIFQTKHQFVVKYDWYDPNTIVSGDAIGKSGSKVGSADVKYTTIGLGWNYRWDTNVKLSAYYDIVTNETTKNLTGYTQDKKDNVLTLRLQYRF